MKVAVLVLTYNHENYIAQAIESVLNQETRFKYEIVIIEDCSTDSTRDIVIDYRKRYPGRIRLVLAEKNRNDNVAWARELIGSQSKYVALLDGDDYWTSPHKLQKQADYLDRHPECTICCHNVFAFYVDGSREPYNFNPDDQKKISTLEDLWDYNFIAGCSPMLRSGVMRKLPDWFYSMNWGDWALYILWARSGKIGYIDEVMGAYRIHSGGCWSGLSKVQQMEQVIDFYEEMNVNLGFAYNERIEIMIAKFYYHLALAHEENGDLRSARACLEDCNVRLALSHSKREESVHIPRHVSELDL
jgi:glycosyltransferase involved in cell wall biosynthesis